MDEYKEKNFNANQYHKEKSRESAEKRHEDNLNYKKEKDNQNAIAKRKTGEIQRETALDLAIQKGEFSVELLQKQFELAPGYSDVEFEDYIRRENIRLQSLQVELNMRTDDKHNRYAVEKKAVILKAMVVFLDNRQQNREARTKHQEKLEVERLKHENNKDFETHKHNLVSGNASGNKEIITADQFEAASKVLRKKSQSLTKEEKIKEFINEPQKK